MKVYTEDEFSKFWKSIKEYIPCDVVPQFPKGIEVEVMIREPVVVTVDSVTKYKKDESNRHLGSF